MRYYPFVTLACHHFFASTDNATLKWPATPFEVQRDTEKNDRIIMEVLQDASPVVKRSLGRRDLVLDVAAVLVRSLRPTIRPITVALLTSEERALVAGVVNTMIAYNLAFKQVRVEGTGAYDYVLDPPLQELLDVGAQPKYSEVRVHLLVLLTMLLPHLLPLDVAAAGYC